MFPSPCGDKLKYACYVNLFDGGVFPSPCGDKLKSDISVDGGETLEVSVPLRG